MFSNQADCLLLLRYEWIKTYKVEPIFYNFSYSYEVAPQIKGNISQSASDIR